MTNNETDCTLVSVMANWLVTGGAGFIGSNLVQALLEKGETVRILDDFSTGRRENLEGLDNAELVEGDVQDIQTVSQSVRDIDYVLHQAALASVTRSVEDPVSCNKVNVGGTINILDAARKAKVKRVVVASSSSVYGETEVLPKRENMAPSPVSPYAVSKLAAEQYARSFTKVYGFETVSLRYFNVFGPRQDPSSQYSAVIPLFLSAILKNENPVIYGDGTQTRDFTFVGNVVNANILAATTPGAAGSIVNIGNGGRISLLGLLEMIARLLGRPVNPVFAPKRPGDVMHSQADVSMALKYLGYKPEIDLESGLEKSLDYYRTTC